MRVRVPAVGKRFVNGLASAYSSVYPKELANVMTEDDFKDFIDRLNHTIISHWPCDICYVCGFALAPLSCGLSLLAPAQCVQDVKVHADNFLEQYSYKASFYERDIVFTLEVQWFNSFILISFPDSLAAKANKLMDVEQSPLTAIGPTHQYKKAF